MGLRLSNDGSAPASRCIRAGAILAIHHSMRTRIWLIVIAVMALAVVPAASALPVALTVVPIAMLEPGALLLLGITLLTLAGLAQRVFFS